MLRRKPVDLADLFLAALCKRAVLLLYTDSINLLLTVCCCSVSNDIQRYLGSTKLQERQAKEHHGVGVNLHYDFPPYSVNEV
jgi:hypothetical protein